MAEARGGSDVDFLRLYLFEAGFPAPPAATLRELVERLPRLGWRPVPTLLAPLQSGSLFVVAEGDTIQRVGIVSILHQAGVDGPALRDYFIAATDQAARGEQVPLSSVSFFLLPSG